MMRARGFTLVELLVAMGILALLGVSASLLLNTTLENQARIRERAQALESLGMATAILRRDLEQISLRSGRDTYGDAQSSPLISFRRGEPDLVAFVHDGRRRLPGRFQGTSLERVRYVLDGENLLRLSAPVPDPVAQTRWHTQTLLTGVKRFELRYFDGGEWHDNWPPLGAVEEAGLPRVVELDFDTELWSDIRVQALLPEELPRGEG